jgi:hypothetical protein
MTKKILVSLLIAFATATSYAATKCIALNSQTSCRNNYSGAAGNYNAEPAQSDWGSSCTGANGASITVHGIALCGADTGVSSGATVDSVRMSGTVADNKYCYRKMVQPVVSRWVFAKTHHSDGDCAWWCQNTCADFMNNNTNGFRSSVLGVLYE